MVQLGNILDVNFIIHYESLRISFDIKSGRNSKNEDIALAEPLELNIFLKN